MAYISSFHCNSNVCYQFLILTFWQERKLLSERGLELIASKQMLSNKVVGKIDYKKLINNRKLMLFAFDKKNSTI